jgi:hypothetical protein
MSNWCVPLACILAAMNATAACSATFRPLDRQSSAFIVCHTPDAVRVITENELQTAQELLSTQIPPASRDALTRRFISEYCLHGNSAIQTRARRVTTLGWGCVLFSSQMPGGIYYWSECPTSSD